MSNGHSDRASGRVRLRGTRDGIDIQLPAHLSSDELISQFTDEVAATRDFLRDASVHLALGERDPERREINCLLDVLRERGIEARSITVARPEHRALLREWGLASVRIDSRAPAPRRAADSPPDERSALYVKRTLRSGASIHGDGDVVILGDVNPGAQVSAAGDIIVWGVLRGTVHAGSTGDDTVRICALRLQPTQLRIGAIVARPPDGKQAAADGPHSAYIQDAMIVVEPWRGLERRGRAG
ncbi:MAG TPA: septum site-determining protein MinC [Thermomicrobiales bacterium]|nr:septum site-determining protein MinC [Thermomicrobiales bacterium]